MELIQQEQTAYKLILKDGTFYDVTQEEIGIFKQAYPKINVEDQVRRMVAWCYSNSSQRKTRRGIKKFINGWLSRQKPESAIMSQREYVRTTSIHDQLTDDSWAK